MIFDTGLTECLFALTAGTTFAAVLLTAFIAAPCLGIVDAEALADAGDVSLGDIGVRSVHTNVDVSAGTGGSVNGVDELRTAVWIDRVVAGMVGDHHALQSVALGDAHGDGEHDSVAERYDRRLHILLVVVAFGDGVGTLQETALEILVHEVQGNRDMFDAEAFTVHLGKGNLPGIVVAAIIETDAQSDLIFLVIEEGDGVHTSADDNYRIFHYVFVFDFYLF